MPASSYDRTPVVTDWRERYEIVGKIGSGGSADVYEAVDLESGHDVALKVVDERAALAGRVVREVEAARALDHPDIVALLDFFSDGRRSFLVWELVRGESLAQLVGELRDDEAVLAVAQLCEALAYAHARGVVHRDIKPQNVMVDHQGVVKVMDFGIARLADADTLTAEGELLGTVAYMSPEQAAGRRVGPPTDVYSAGLLLYELLAGENPVRGASAGETVGNILAGRIAPLEQVRPDLPRELCDAVAAACSLRAGERPSAVETAEALRGVSARLGGRHRLHPRRLLAPLRRLDVIAQRGLGAALVGASLAALLARLPAYPPRWTLPVALAAALIWLVAPRVGLAFALGAAAFPLFNVSLSAGLAYLPVAVVVFIVFRRRPLMCVWPALALLLAPLSGTLLAVCAAAAFGRRRAPFVAAWTAVVTYLVLAPGRAGAYRVRRICGVARTGRASRSGRQPRHGACRGGPRGRELALPRPGGAVRGARAGAGGGVATGTPRSAPLAVVCGLLDLLYPRARAADAGLAAARRYRRAAGQRRRGGRRLRRRAGAGSAGPPGRRGPRRRPHLGRRLEHARRWAGDLREGAAAEARTDARRGSSGGLGRLGRGPAGGVRRAQTCGSLLPRAGSATHERARSGR